MKTILLFGAGKSASVLIKYLIKESEINHWKFIVADANKEMIESKTGGSKFAEAIQLDITNDVAREKLIQRAHVVISMMPPALHFLIAKDCVEWRKHLLTASYLDNNMKSLRDEINHRKLLFLCEMGLDPGIDHMSAMKIIDDIKEKGGTITSFKSHCGGLVAPESDNNPWHYKISWNPRSVVLAGKAGAHFKENGIEKKIPYAELFTTERMVEIPEIGLLSWYPNRDSLSYSEKYGLTSAQTFIRTTLRHPDFMYGWKNIIDLKLTDEAPQYETDGKTLYQLFKEHMDKNGFGEWLEEKLNERFAKTKDMLENLMKLMEVEQEAEDEEQSLPESFMAADDQGNLETIEIDDIKNKAAAFVAHNMHEANLTLKQLFFLGLDDQETQVNKGLCSPADILQFAIEKKLALRPYDKDMIIMLHEFEYTVDNKNAAASSLLIVKGEDNLHTAMAKTVGLPLGIAAKLILNGKIKLTGLHIPTAKEIYEPVLKELELNDVIFHEEWK